jgi:hypothetical protein
VKALKIVMFVMIALVVLALGVVGYFFLTAKVSVTASGAQGQLASQNTALFDQLKTQLDESSFQGTRFSTDALGNAEDYAFITYTVRLSNQCLVPIDMVEVQVEPDAGDVLQIGDISVHSLKSRSVGDITATILTTKNNDAAREVVISYYVWGVSFSIRRAIGG